MSSRSRSRLLLASSIGLLSVSVLTGNVQAQSLTTGTTSASTLGDWTEQSPASGLLDDALGSLGSLDQLGTLDTSGGLGDITSTLGNLSNVTTLGKLGGLGSILSGGNGAQQSGNPVFSFLQQVAGIQSQVDNVIDTVLDKVGGSLGDALSKAIKDALGVMNLPDPGALLENVQKATQQNQPGQNGGAVSNNVSGVSAGILNFNQAQAVQKKVFDATFLSKDAQANIQKELQTVLQLVQGSGQLVQSSSQLAEQSGQAAQQAGQVGQAASQAAQQAQSRVSTQDALKDLNKVTASLGDQLSALSGQSATQSGQLSNITGLQSSQLQVQGNTAARTSQIAITSAIAAQQVMEMNSQLRGQEQLRVMQGVAQADQLNQSVVQGMSLLR